jgi:hypothetical protein
MRWLAAKAIIAALALGFIGLRSAEAGRNAGGSLILHTADTYEYSTATACTTASGEPASCAEAVTRTDRDQGAVLWLLAAFDPTASPGVTVVYFGIRL